MRVRYALAARFDIDGIYEFLAKRNPTAASRVVTRIRQAAERLGEFPHLGHVGRAPATFEWTVRRLPYIIVYEVREERAEVVVLGVFHGAQDR
jgi:toxin ParE1/3/4